MPRAVHVEFMNKMPVCNVALLACARDYRYQRAGPVLEGSRECLDTWAREEATI
jgi:hypothetical protein